MKIEHILKLREVESVEELILNLQDELREVSEDEQLERSYEHALNTMCIKSIESYFDWGRNIRQQLINIADYNQGLPFGFDAKLFNEYGWLDNHEWISTTEKHISSPSNNYSSGAVITIKESINRSFCYGLRINYHRNSGSAFGACPYSSPRYLSYDTCLDAALNFLLADCKRKLMCRDLKPKEVLSIENMIEVIKSEINKRYQLSIF